MYACPASALVLRINTPTSPSVKLTPFSSLQVFGSGALASMCLNDDDDESIHNSQMSADVHKVICWENKETQHKI